MVNILSINTTDNKKILISIGTTPKEREVYSSKNIIKSEMILTLIDKLLKKNNLNLDQIHAIKVNIGPGSYTGTRVGVAIANILGVLLKIPINGKEIGDLAKPIYNR